MLRCLYYKVQYIYLSIITVRVLQTGMLTSSFKKLHRENSAIDQKYI